MLAKPLRPATLVRKPIGFGYQELIRRPDRAMCSAARPSINCTPSTTARLVHFCTVLGPGMQDMCGSGPGKRDGFGYP